MQPSNSDPRIQPWWRARLASFGYALNGLKVLIATQPHARFHLFATLVVLLAGWWFSLSLTSWAILILAIGAVWTAEAFNSAVEFLVDLVHPDWHHHAGRIKDLSAAAVLLASITAAVVGILIFGSYAVKFGYLPWLG